MPTLLHALGYNPSAALVRALVDEVWPCSHQMSRNLTRVLFRQMPHTRTSCCTGLTKYWLFTLQLQGAPGAKACTVPLDKLHKVGGSPALCQCIFLSVLHAYEDTS